MDNVEGNDIPSFKKLFKRDILNFRVMGMGSMGGILSNDKLNTHWWESILIFFMIIALDTIEMFQVNTIYQIFNDQLTYAIQLFGLTCSGVLSTIKIIRLWTYRLELYDLLQNLRTMWEFAQTQNYITKKISDIAERTRVINMYYTLILATGIIEYITHPYICILQYQLSKDINSTYDFTNFVLPVAYWFSIDSYSTYFICITHQQLAVFITVISWAASDTLFAQLTTHVSLQLQVLANELKETINNSDHLDNDRGMIKKLGNIAAKYQQLFMFTRLIETLFNPIIFFTVLSNAMNLCTSIYRMDQEITDGNWNEVFKQILYIMSLSMQTAVFCMFTESLAESSTMISDTIYQSKWMNCDQKSKMTLLIIMIRAQKEFKCTAYGIIDLNHNQMKQIANTTVSYFMLLRSMS
ncbi:hypothetical protein PV327_007741 [Microctonus hyperodae]|uniref:Odorant receptor n=1 Tax=Microctonus hyperodae TaxID=165561 RepID=A0AA39KYY6_MICHY|nr:hypothetical protein PV327_007741 [Microctonus hyperodae]